jgi:hypothetical protein
VIWLVVVALVVVGLKMIPGPARPKLGPAQSATTASTTESTNP